MPLVQIRWFPGRSAEQKQALATRITQAFGEVVGSAPDHVSIIFEEVARVASDLKQPLLLSVNHLNAKAITFYLRQGCVRDDDDDK
jgi:4-oxalocrotonate tautomerase